MMKQFPLIALKPESELIDVCFMLSSLDFSKNLSQRTKLENIEQRQNWIGIGLIMILKKH